MKKLISTTKLLEFWPPGRTLRVLFARFNSGIAEAAEGRPHTRFQPHQSRFPPPRGAEKNEDQEVSQMTDVRFLLGGVSLATIALGSLAFGQECDMTPPPGALQQNDIGSEN